MPPKVILLCGKVCCGKTTYAKQIRKGERAVILSCDEIMLALFDQQLGDRHERISQATQHFLFKKSLELLRVGVTVILDWGFWTKASRNEARAFYMLHEIPCELHYLDIAEPQWSCLIANRNAKINPQKPVAYYVDLPLKQKCQDLFEEPSPEEVTLRHTVQPTDSLDDERDDFLENIVISEYDARNFDLQRFLKDHENDIVAFVHGSWNYQSGEGSYTCRLYYQQKSKTLHHDFDSIESSNLAMICGAKAVCESIKRENMTVYLITPTNLGLKKGLRNKGVNKEYIQEIFGICKSKSLELRSLTLINGSELFQNLLYK